MDGLLRSEVPADGETDFVAPGEGEGEGRNETSGKVSELFERRVWEEGERDVPLGNKDLEDMTDDGFRRIVWVREMKVFTCNARRKARTKVSSSSRSSIVLPLTPDLNDCKMEERLTRTVCHPLVVRRAQEIPILRVQPQARHDERISVRHLSRLERSSVSWSSGKGSEVGGGGGGDGIGRREGLVEALRKREDKRGRGEERK